MHLKHEIMIKCTNIDEKRGSRDFKGEKPGRSEGEGLRGEMR